MLDQEFWIFVNTFAPWLSAIGTILAVCISLYLASTRTRVKIEALAAISVINEQLYFSVMIVNTGPFEVEITNIGISNIFKKYMHVLINFDKEFSSTLPKRLSFGQSADYFIALSNKNDWLKFRFAEFIQPYPKILIHTLRIVIFTSINKQFYCRNTLKKDILEAINM
jgi:hypothetical protein